MNQQIFYCQGIFMCTKYWWSSETNSHLLIGTPRQRSISHFHFPCKIDHVSKPRNDAWLLESDAKVVSLSYCVSRIAGIIQYLLEDKSRVDQRIWHPALIQAGWACFPVLILDFHMWNKVWTKNPRKVLCSPNHLPRELNLLIWPVVSRSQPGALLCCHDGSISNHNTTLFSATCTILEMQHVYWVS